MILGLAWLAACDPYQEVCAAHDASALDIVVGAGTAEWVPLNDGDTLGFEFGPQGGIHSWGGFQARGFYPGTGDYWDKSAPLIDFVIDVDDGQFFAGYEAMPRPLRQLDDGGYLALGERLVYDTAAVSALEGRPATITAALEDVCGNRVEDTRAVTLTETPLE